MRLLFVLFIVVPILEMFVLIKVGSLIGALSTIALVLLTAMVGISLIRWQGFETLRRAQQKMQSGTLPATEMMEGLCLAFGGALLLTPGFITDALGFSLLIPGLRLPIIRFFQSRLSVYAAASGANASRHTDQSHNTIDGDFRRED